MDSMDEQDAYSLPTTPKRAFLPGLTVSEPRPRKKFRPEDKPFVCECGRSFTLKGNLTKHQKLHINSKPFKCEIPGCGKTFTQAIGLTRHTMTHNNEKPYVCPVEGCSKAFAQPGNLNAHLRIHTGDKPFVCTSCNRAFAQKGNLTTHMLYHSTEKPFVCNVNGCGQAFSLKGNLKKHAKIHQQQNGMDLMYDIPTQAYQGQDPNIDWQMQQQKYWQESLMNGYSFPMPEGLTEAQQQEYMQQLQYQQMLQQQYQYLMYRNHLMQTNPSQFQEGLTPGLMENDTHHAAAVGTNWNAGRGLIDEYHMFPPLDQYEAAPAHLPIVPPVTMVAPQPPVQVSTEQEAPQPITTALPETQDPNTIKIEEAQQI